MFLNSTFTINNNQYLIFTFHILFDYICILIISVFHYINMSLLCLLFGGLAFGSKDINKILVLVLSVV